MTRPTKLRYYSEFVSRLGRRWRIEIRQNFERGKPQLIQPIELSLPADEPLVIEWDETAKHDAIRPGRATLTAESPTDRTFLHLFQTPPGTVMLEVYLYQDNNSKQLYWRGFLDPELYEEPYTRAGGYDVTLTFTDLAILSRLRPKVYDRSYTTIRDLVESIIGRSGQEPYKNALQLYYYKYYNGSEFGATTKGLPTFYYGEASSYYQKLETDYFKINPERYQHEDLENGIDLLTLLDELASPYGAIVWQRLGKIHCMVPEYTSLFGLPIKKTHWEWADAVLSTDRTYNMCKATFKPGAPDSLLRQPKFPDVGTDLTIKTWGLRGLSIELMSAFGDTCFDSCGMTFGMSEGESALFPLAYSGIFRTVPYAKTNIGYQGDTTYPATGSAVTGFFRAGKKYGLMVRTPPIHFHKGTTSNLYILEFDHRWQNTPGFDMSIVKYSTYFINGSHEAKGSLTYADNRTPKWQDGITNVDFSHNGWWDTGQNGGSFEITDLESWTDDSGAAISGKHYRLIFPVPENCYLRISFNAGNDDTDGISMISGLTFSEGGTFSDGKYDPKNETVATQGINNQAEDILEKEFIFGASKFGVSRTAYGNLLTENGDPFRDQGSNYMKPHAHWCQRMKREYAERNEVLSGTIRLDPDASLLYTDQVMGEDIIFQKVASKQNIILDTDQVKLIRQRTPQAEKIDLRE